MADETPPQEGAQEPVKVTTTAPAVTVEGNNVEPDWKAESRKHEKRSKESFAELTKLKAELEEIRSASQSEQEKAIDKARREAVKEATAEVTSGFQQRVLKSEIRAQAAGRFADPDDAVRLLDLDDDIFDGEGEVQTSALKKALDDLLERKPHLAAERQQQVGDVDAGKGEGPTSGDMNDLIRQRVRG
jgi:hypothetical protein